MSPAELAAVYIAADNAMRDRVREHPEERGAALAQCTETQARIRAQLTDLGYEVGAAHGDGDPFRMVGLDLSGPAGYLFVGRKPNWAEEQDRAEAAREAAEEQARREREQGALERAGYASVADLRTALGPRATRAAWTARRCAVAAAARARVARGDDGAATWACALWGEADEDSIYLVAVQGVADDRAARARWASKLEVLDRIGRAFGVAP